MNAMLEIRNDPIGDCASQAAMAQWLSRCLAEARGADGYVGGKRNCLKR